MQDCRRHHALALRWPANPPCVASQPSMRGEGRSGGGGEREGKAAIYIYKKRKALFSAGCNRALRPQSSASRAHRVTRGANVVARWAPGNGVGSRTSLPLFALSPLRPFILRLIALTAPSPMCAPERASPPCCHSVNRTGLYVLYHRQSIPASQKLGRIGAAAFGCGLLTLGVIRGAM